MSGYPAGEEPGRHTGRAHFRLYKCKGVADYNDARNWKRGETIHDASGHVYIERICRACGYTYMERTA